VKPFGGLQSLLTENMRCFLMARFRKESYHERADGLCELAYIRLERGREPHGKPSAKQMERLARDRALKRGRR
jgi:hypothetical protein